jgi:hypothetical protein
VIAFVHQDGLQHRIAPGGPGRSEVVEEPPTDGKNLVILMPDVITPAHEPVEVAVEPERLVIPSHPREIDLLLVGVFQVQLQDSRDATSKQCASELSVAS